MYHNFVFCEGAADTGDRGRILECNFIIIIIIINLGLLYTFISPKCVVLYNFS